MALNQADTFAQARNSLELNGLNKIRQQSRDSDDATKQGALKEAAQQFEGIFMKMLLSSMRKAQDVLASDSPLNSQSTKFYRDMHDQQMAVELSSNGSLGLTDLIVRQLGGDSDNFTPSSVLRNDGNLPLANPLASTSTARQKNTLLTQIDTHEAVEATASATAHHNKDSVHRSFVPGIAGQPRVDMSFSGALKQSANQGVNTATPSFEQPKDFVSALVKPAKRVQEKLGVPFEVVIAQAALETGWGQKIIKGQDGNSSNNVFNIKADSRWNGDKVSKETLEFEQGAMVKKVAPFRRYQSISESVNDYVNFLSNNERYAPALQKPSNVEHFLHGLQKAGYATDPHYANKILATLNKVTNLLAK